MYCIVGYGRNEPSAAGVQWVLKQASDVTAGPTWKRKVSSSVARLKKEQQLTEGLATQPCGEEIMSVLTVLESRLEMLAMVLAKCKGC